MNFKNNYWYFTKALPDHFCDKLIEFGKSKKEQLGITGGLQRDAKKSKHSQVIHKEEDLKEEELLNLKKRRDSNIVWLSEKWLYRYLHHYVRVANHNSGWNFEWSYSEAAQFTKYKLNQFYDWHCDSWKEPYGDKEGPELKGKIRKLSMTCSLSDPKDYKGGEFEFKLNDDINGDTYTQICKEVQPKGSIVIFPSDTYHRVKPVTEGIRYSLVLWSCGNSWK